MLPFAVGLLLAAQCINVVHAECPAKWLDNLQGVWQASYRSSVDQEVATVFNISLCSPLPAETGCTDAAVCMRSLGGKDVTRIGRWSSDAEVQATANASSAWEYKIAYKADCAARPDADGVVMLEFWCGTTLGAPEVVFSDAVNCRHTIVWRTWAACHSRTVAQRRAYAEKPCYVLDRKGGLVDLSRLVHFNGATTVTLGNTNYFFDMCRRISRDPHSTHIPQACDKSALCSSPVADPMTGTVLAVNASALMYDADNDAVFVRFAGATSDECPKGFNATIHLSCPAQQGAERGISMESSGKCVMEFAYVTQHACPRSTHISESCVMKQGSTTYDLRPLTSSSKNGYLVATGSKSGVTFEINPCAAFTSDDGCESVTACQIDDNGKAHALGRTFDRQLHLVDGEFAMTLEHGERCSNRLHRITVIQFQCNRTLGLGRPNFVREDDCVYIFDWANNITCTDQDSPPATTPSSSGTKGGEAAKEQESHDADESDKNEPLPLCQTSQVVGGKTLHYNLSPLTNDKSNWQVVTGKDERAYTYFINVCRAVVRTGRAANCSESAAACQVRSDAYSGHAAGGGGSHGPPAFSAGRFVAAPTVEAGMVTLRYRHGTKCHHAGERETVVRFVCAPGVTTSSPVFEDELDNCTYAFQWHTAYACPETAQRSVGDACSVTDAHSGYTLDVSKLGTLSALVGDTNYSVASCGQSVKAACKQQDGGLCAFPEAKPDEATVKAAASSALEFKHGQLSGVYTQADDACLSKQRRVTVQYLCPPRPDAFQRETKEKLPADGSIHVDPESVRVDDCNMIVHWYTGRVCVVSPEQCVVRDGAGQVQYDLSALSVAKVNESNWKAESSNGTELFLINVCRPLMAVHGCHPHSAVCSVRPAAASTRPTDPRHHGAVVNPNLGLGTPATTAMAIIFSGEVQIVYTSQPTSGGKAGSGGCKTTINFHCKKSVPVGHPVFVEKISGACSYVFDWETSKACKLTEETSGTPDISAGGDTPAARPAAERSCTVADQSGYIFNMYALHNHTDDYAVANPENNNVKLRLNICAALAKPCGDDKTAASCITKADGSEVSGGAANRTIRYFDGTLRLEYLNGAACSSGGARKGKTIIEFTCDRSTHISSPVITNSEDACEFIVSWPTPLACPQQSVPCRVDYGGSLYDLSPLHLAKGYWDAIMPANSDYRFMINVCGAVDDFKIANASNCANGHTSVCQVGKPAHKGSTGVYNAGSSQSSPIALKDGLLELRLSNGDQCYHHHQRVRSTVIQFECDPLHTGAPEFQTESDCEYRFLWRTRYACAPRTKKGHDCTVGDPYFPDHRYDLNPLAKLGPQTFSYENKTTNDTYGFVLSVCGKLSADKACGNGNDKAGACQLKGGKALAAAGDANGGLTYADGNLELLYWHVPDATERRCHGRFVRSTRVIFMCDRSQHDGPRGSGPVMREEMGDCQYVVEWYTPLACNPSFHEAPCTASSPDGQVYDLTSLALTRGAWQASNALSARRYFLSVCGELNTGYAAEYRPCAFSAAVCGVDTVKNTSRSYGQVHKLSVEEHGVFARYSDGSDCTDPGNPKASHYSTLIRFSCRQGSKGTPNLVEETGCQSVFEWASEAACGTSGDVPKPTPGGASKPPAAVPTTVPLVLPKCVVESASTHAVFDLRPLTGKVYSLTDASGMAYNLSICGVLPEGSCPGQDNPPHASVCQQTKRNGGKEWVSAGSGGGKLSYESGMVRLVIPGGLPCHHNKQARKTVVQFYCDRGTSKQDEATFHGKPVFDREEDCVYTVRWPTHLACEKELKCSITDKKSHEVFDLSSLSKFNDNWQATSKTSNGSFLINVCRPLTPLSSNKCDFSASSCWLNGGKYTSLGHINSGSLKQTADGTVLLSYSGGAGSKGVCPAGRTTNISFHCGKESPGPVLTSVDGGGCDYHFQWMTPLVCTKAQLKKEEQGSVVNAKKCTVTDAVSGDAFDLSRLYDGDRSHTVKGSKHTYYLNPCGEGIKDRDDCKNADVCSTATGTLGAPSVADTTSRSVSYQYRTNTLNVSYTGGKCSGDRKWKTTILFVCSKAASYGEPMLLAEDDCRLLFHWPTKFACGTAASECFLKASGQNTIDLTPLARHRGSWHVRTSDGDRFWLNLCAPVHEHVDGCSSDAAVCWQKEGVGSRKAVSIGAASLRRLHTGPDHKAAVLEYFSHQLCQQDPSRTYQVKIVLSCDPKKRFSEPVFQSAEDCVFRFNWQTLTACPVGTRAGIQQHSSQCGYQDSFKNFVDLSTELSSHRLYKTQEGTFHLQLCSSQALHCGAGAAACHESQSGGTLETIASSGYKNRLWTGYADGALLEVKSSRPCAADRTRNHSVFVNFLCDSVKSLEFDHSSEHCHYVFTWKTPAVCTHLPTQKALVTTVPSGDGAGGIGQHGGGGGSSGHGLHPTKNNKPGGVSTLGVVVLVVLCLVVIVIAAVIYRSDDRRAMASRIFCFWRGAPQSPTTRRSYKQLSLNEEQRELIESTGEADNDMLAGGDDDEQLLAL